MSGTDRDTVSVEREVLHELVETAKGKLEADVSRWGPEDTGYDVDQFAETIESAERSLQSDSDQNIATDGGRTTMDRYEELMGSECPECGVEIDGGSLRYNGWAWEHKNPEAHPQAGHHVIRETIDDEQTVVTDGGLRRHGGDAIRTLAGVGDQDPTCPNGTLGCPGPDADASELPCAGCFLSGDHDE